ncbi:DUF6328 family protein [Leucobacter chromiiresistens]|uniref:Sodium:proton antiporter n=1 Tax=Leucobacter chromiiresistens TaxID=1079994 RepID=A0A147ENQ5_9MICO|nr:DUF6328 family protein [Leucobacter chromiiresistens]KTR86160.1 sodium:proton antiporter [Leucobacter chromiiresistens]
MTDVNGDGRSETTNERADRNWNEILQELRVAQTGTQILGGFLLALAFQPRFQELDAFQLTLYLVLVGLAGVAAVLGLAPVTLHRTFFGKGRKPEIVRLGGRMLSTDLVVLALLAAGVTGLVFDVALGRAAGFVTLAIGAVVVIGVWGVLPRLVFRRGSGPDPRGPGDDV